MRPSTQSPNRAVVMVQKKSARSRLATKKSLVVTTIPALGKQRNAVLQRLLVLAALLKQVNPAPKPISKLLDDAYKARHPLPAEPPAYFNVDRVSSYLGKMQSGRREVSFPRESAEVEGYLEILNFLLFDEEDKLYIKSFDLDLNTLEPWNLFGPKVEEFLRPEMSDFAENGPAILISVDSADPGDLDAQIAQLRRGPGALSSHLLYHSPKGAQLWETIKQANSYAAHYMHCQTGLQVLLSKPYLRQSLSQSRIVFNLGAGSYSKDILILRAMQELARDRAPMDRSIYCWVDASLAMLRETWKRNSGARFPSVILVSMAVDFEQPTNIQSLYESSGHRWPVYGSKKIFFILGFTVSTLREEKFLEEYASHCLPGDIIVFSIQFIPETCRKNTENLDEFKKSVLDNYDFPDGWKLAAAGLALSERYDVEGPVSPKIESYRLPGSDEYASLRLSFKASLKRANGPQSKFEVTTAETFRHFETPYLRLLRQHGFAVRDEANGGDNVKTLAIEFVGRNIDRIGE